jgi:hypothetical protein
MGTNSMLKSLVKGTAKKLEESKEESKVDEAKVGIFSELKRL